MQAQVMSYGISLLLLALYGLGLAGVARRLGRDASRDGGYNSLCMGFAASPFAAGLGSLAWIAVLGRQPDATYVWANMGGATLLAVLFARWAFAPLEPRQADAGPRQPWRWRRLFSLEFVLGLAALYLLAILAYLVFVIPLIENDSLEYATVGKIMYERRELGAYPLTHPDPVTGMYAPWTHPPLYIGLIFLGYVIQGSATVPGLMRVIAPTCLLLASGLLLRLSVASGATRRWRIGLLAVIFLLSVPLLRRMVGGASIDALPLLGLLLAFCAAYFYSASPPRSRAILLGACLGFSLWTHSQAIIFPVLIGVATALMRWIRREPLLKELAGASLITAAIGCWPYVRNLEIFGSPISDTPAVFAMGELDWDSYFTVARGLGDFWDIVLVGVLKGWTDLPAFGVAFWLMTAGAVVVAPQFRARAGTQQMSVVLVAAVGMLLVYFAGVVASVLLGSSQMIRNARYLLPLTPFVALLASYFLVEQTRLPASASIRRTASRIMFRADLDLHAKSIAMLCVIALVVAAWRHDTAHALTYWRYHLGSLSKAASAPTEWALQRFPFYRAQEALNRLPENAVVLSLRPADMYYAQRQMVSYLDPRLIPAYRERTPEGIARRLEALGVTHIYRPNYSIPPIYRSALMPMLSDARFVSLEFTDGYYDLYKLKREATDSPTAVIERLEVSPNLRTWSGESESRFMLLEGICRQEGLEVKSSDPQPTPRACSLLPDQHARYILGTLPPNGTRKDAFLDVTAEALYRYRISVAGEGLVRVVAYERSRGGRLEVTQMDDALLSADGIELTRMFRVGRDTTGLRLALYVDGDGYISIKRVILETLEGPRDHRL